MRSWFGEQRQGAWLVVAVTLIAVITNVVFYATQQAPWLLSPEGEIRPHQGEWHLPVFISIFLSAYAGLATHRVGSLLKGRERHAARYLSYLFWWMAIDDFLAIHEKIERFSRIAWLFVYAPLMAAAAGAGVYLVRRTRMVPGTGGFRTFALLGACAWFVSQILEAVGQFWDDAKYHAMELIVPEETLETLGSTCFALAALSLVIALTRHRVARAGRARAEVG